VAHTTVPDVAAWLQLGNDGSGDDVLQDCVTAADSIVTRYVGEAPGDDAVPSTADAHQAATMLAARLYRRRNSPEGIAGITPEGVAVGIVRSDADIARLLRIDAYSTPQVG